MKSNKWIQKQEAVKQQLVQAAGDVYSQYQADCSMMVLRDKFGFGSKRLYEFGLALREYQEEFSPALHTSHPECGYTQECMDRKLQDALKEYFEAPFPERYEWLKKVDV